MTIRLPLERRVRGPRRAALGTDRGGRGRPPGLSHSGPATVSNRGGFTLVETAISVAILALCLGGLINGYIISTRYAEYSGYSLAGQALALRQMEQVRAAKWDLGAFPVVDQVVATNFPTATLPLDFPRKGTNITYATITTTITQVQNNPPLKCIKVTCTWPFINGETGTNEMVTYRAPDTL